jgi:hypothetical protein
VKSELSSVTSPKHRREVDSSVTVYNIIGLITYGKKRLLRLFLRRVWETSISGCLKELNTTTNIFVICEFY